MINAIKETTMSNTRLMKLSNTCFNEDFEDVLDRFPLDFLGISGDPSIGLPLVPVKNNGLYE